MTSAPSAEYGVYGPRLRPPSVLASSSRQAVSCSGVTFAMSSGYLKLIRTKGGGLTGNGCVGEYHSPGTSPLGTGRSSIGQIGFPVTLSNTYKKACLLGCPTAFTVRPSIVISVRMGA